MAKKTDTATGTTKQPAAVTAEYKAELRYIVTCPGGGKQHALAESAEAAIEQVKNR